MNKRKVAILYGGRSVEHGVSINSARNIFEYVDRTRFEPIPIGISQKGVWYLNDLVSKDIEKGRPLSLTLNASKPSFITADSSFLPDIVFPVLHGTDGEDGSIQGLLKAMELPMVGSGVLGSALSMNKLVAKRLMKESGLPVVTFEVCYYNERGNLSFDKLEKKFGLPFMVKSASLGSSIGVSKVKSRQDFDKAVDEAFRFDECLLIEKYISGREIECAILGNSPSEASLPGEIVISNQYDFYTFDAKYVDPKAVSIHVPAKLSPPEIEMIREYSLKAFHTLACEDFARVDLFLTSDGRVYINEINTIPGFTNSSMFPMMWQERGISFSELISRLLDLAQKRFDHSRRLSRDFNSSLTY